MASASTRARETCARVASVASRARVVDDAVDAFVASLSDAETARLRAGARSFDALGAHGASAWEDEVTAAHCLVVDAMNFCFWPDHDAGGGGGVEYEHVAGGWRRAIERDARAVSAERLRVMTGEELRNILGWPRPLPNEEERARLVREVGEGLATAFGGSCVELVRSANGSATKLVDIVLMHFPGFHDATIYRGRQVFFYKRAQIFVGDIWGAFGGVGLGKFHDINELTMFADYRVPVILREHGILRYDADLLRKIVAKEEIAANSEEEIEIRACTVSAVEKIRDAFELRHGERVSSIVIDWLLWEQGEARRDTSEEPHHRTLTIFY